jgi:hypothetical protein
MGQDDSLVTPNEIVAYNLRRARDLKGWTQEAAATALEPFLGVKWTGPSFSVAERWKPQPGQKVRQFGADEIVAFAAAFELPIGFFFRTPSEAGAVRLPGQIGLPVDVYAVLVTDPQELRREVDDLEQHLRDLVEAARALGINLAVPPQKQPDSVEEQTEELEALRARREKLTQDTQSARRET